MILQIGNIVRTAYRVPRTASRKTQSAVRNSQYDNKGLTLIEVLLAVSILAIGIIGVLRAYAGSMVTLEVGQFNIDAINVLRQQMSEVELEILEEGKNAPSSGNGTLDDFIWEWTINTTDTEYLNELVFVVSHQYNPRIFTLKTYVVEEKEEEEEEL